MFWGLKGILSTSSKANVLQLRNSSDATFLDALRLSLIDQIKYLEVDYIENRIQFHGLIHGLLVERAK
jgi:hypothetical protein